MGRMKDGQPMGVPMFQSNAFRFVSLVPVVDLKQTLNWGGKADVIGW